MEAKKRVLITGGSGVIGTRLTEHLLASGHPVAHLGRSKRKSSVETYLWNPANDTIDPDALSATDVVIHLAGEGIADKRWSKKRKREILESRTKSTSLLVKSMASMPNSVRVFVSASGISYYGLGDPPSRGFTESDPPADDFMAKVTVAWEKGVDAVSPGVRVVKFRTGVVLSEKGGALSRLALPVKLLVGAPLGTGRQYFNWIHLDDICSMYVKAVMDESMSGVYNAVAPNPVTNREATEYMARALRRPLWLPPIPAFAVKLIGGEVAELVLKGGRVSSEKIEKTGFEFQFRTIDKALADLLT